MERKIIIKLSILAASFISLLISYTLPVYGESHFTLTPDKKKIEMGLYFGGDTITFHGTFPQPGTSLIVKVESNNNPPLKLVRKGKVVFFWMAVKQFEISNVPFLYKILCSGDINKTLNKDLKKKLGIGYESLRENMELELLKGKSSQDDKQVVFDGFVKMKEKFGLYEVIENAIKIRDDFSFTFDLPFSDRSVEGEYKVECFAIKNGKMVGKAETTITIEKVGLARWITNMAHNYSAIYGIIAVIVAISVGLLAGFIFKGGGH